MTSGGGTDRPGDAWPPDRLDLPPLKRGVGYSRRSVHELLSNRDQIARRASRQARDALDHAERLHAELEDARRHVAELTERAEAAEAQIASLQAKLRDATRDERRVLDVEARAARLDLALRTARNEVGDYTGRLQAAELRVSELEARMRFLGPERDALRDRVVQLSGELDRVRADRDRLRTEIEALGGQPGGADVTVSLQEADPLTEEVAGALRAAEMAVTKIVESARLKGEEELEELERVQQQVRMETDQLTAWRRSAEPTLGDLGGWLRETRRRTADLAEQIREVLEPAASALDELNRRLRDIGDVPGGSPIPSGDQSAHAQAGAPRPIIVPEAQRSDQRAGTDLAAGGVIREAAR